MPDYCPECGAELGDEPLYCPECGAAVEDKHEPDTTDGETTTDRDSWEWLDPQGPFESPRRVLGTLNKLGFSLFAVVIGISVVGPPIAAFPPFIVTALSIIAPGVVFIGVPLWGLMLIADNILGSSKNE